MAVVAIGAVALMAGVRFFTPAEAVCGANPCITVDADPVTAGIQTNIVVATGANFDISLEASAIPASTVQGYQWQIGFDAAEVNFVSATENTGGTGASLCSPPANNASAPGGTEWWGGGSGCLSAAGFLPAGAVRLTTITLQCDAAAPAGSTSPLHLVTGGDGATGEDPTFGTIFLGAGGTFITTDLTDASVQCGEGGPIPTDTSEPPTVTATNTPGTGATSTPTSTVTNTPQPTATNTPGTGPTDTPTATSTTAPPPTNTPVPGATDTPVPTATNTPVPTTKVVICHYDRNLRGPNAGPHTITISVNALEHHLENHVKASGFVGDDSLGACEADAQPTTQ
jgi:hypothetical protein